MPFFIWKYYIFGKPIFDTTEFYPNSMHDSYLFGSLLPTSDIKSISIMINLKWYVLWPHLVTCFNDVSMCHLLEFIFSLKKWKYLFFNSAPDHLAPAANTKFKFGQKTMNKNEKRITRKNSLAETKPNKCQVDITNIIVTNIS